MLVLSGLDFRFPCGAECDEFGVFQFFLIQLFEKLGFLFAGKGKSPFDIIYAHIVQFFGNRYFV